jgi:hypothetical protein
MFSQSFKSLQQESQFVSESFCNGLNHLHKANYMQKTFYYTAFFNLSIALERVMKLILILHHYKNHATFPEDNKIRNLSHNLDKLFAEIKDIDSENLILSEIQTQLMSFLNDFAQKARYSNLDYLSEKQKDYNSPLDKWIKIVSKITINKKERNNLEMKRNLSKAYEEIFGDSVLIRFTSEDDISINNIEDMLSQKQLMSFYNIEAKVLIVQIIRKLTNVLCKIAKEARALDGKEYINIPYIEEFFFLFKNGDNYLKGRKKLSVFC